MYKVTLTLSSEYIFSVFNGILDGSVSFGDDVDDFHHLLTKIISEKYGSKCISLIDKEEWSLNNFNLISKAVFEFNAKSEAMIFKLKHM